MSSDRIGRFGDASPKPTADELVAGCLQQLTSSTGITLTSPEVHPLEVGEVAVFVQ